jgi:hypothetical protein
MNPEFQRNLWLEASPRRIAWGAVVLVLIFGATMVVTRDLGTSRLNVLASIGGVLFGVCGVLWGARAAGVSVLTETGERTWDFQRLSALTPWTMTWGKLFGAASLAWLCALVGLAAFALGAEENLGWNLIFMLGLAVLAQSISLGAALIGVRKARAEGRIARPGGVLWGLMLGGLLLAWLSGSGRFGSGAGLSGLGRLFQGGGSVIWWGAEVSGPTFRALSMAMFAALALAGAWRLMRLELQMRNAPVVWPLFLVLFAAWVAGFPAARGLHAGLLAGGLAVALCAYAAAFAEPADRVRLRRFVRQARAGRAAEALTLAPAALFALLLSMALMAAALVAGGIDAAGWQPMALVAFILRDLAVITLFRFGPRPQRGDFGAVVALGLLYAVGYSVASSLSAKGGAGPAVFAPLDSPLSVVSGLVQAAVAWTLAARRIRMPDIPPPALSAPPSDPASAPGS